MKFSTKTKNLKEFGPQFTLTINGSANLKHLDHVELDGTNLLKKYGSKSYLANIRYRKRNPFKNR